MKKIAFSWLLISILMLSGCYEPQEGCLDASATNFDLDADSGCGDCCTYPALKVSFTHRWPTPDDAEAPLQFSPGWYTDGLGQPFRIKSIRYYWSDLALIDLSGQARRVIDSIDLGLIEAPGDTIAARLPDNFLLAVAGSSNARTLGTFPYPATYQRLEAVFGVIDPANRAAPTSLPQGHPLAPQLGSQHLSGAEGYVFAKIEFYRDTAASDLTPVVLHISGAASRRSLSLALPGEIALPQGANAALRIQTDYSQWFSGANVRGDTAALKQVILNNLPASFSVAAFGRE
jgi:hypothetical protein